MISLLLHLLRLVPFLCGGHRQIALENLALHQQLAVYKRSVTRPKLRTTDRLCLPLIRPIGLMPPAASIRDAVHRRAAPSRLCPDSAAAQSEAWVRLSTAINVSASRCSSRRTSTGSLEDAFADHEAFTSNRADHPLGIRVLPRRAGRNDGLL